MKPQHVLRITAIVWLLALVTAAVIIVLRMDHDPHAIGLHARQWVAHHRIIAPAAFVALYVLLSLSLLPIWWLQVTAGYAFGLLVGVIYCEIASVAAATITVALSHWLAGEWIHEKIEARREKLRRLDEKMGSNGLLIIMAVRLAHIMPFAISNYFFGLTRITLRDTMIGTFLGGLPALIVYVTIGARRHYLQDWRYWTVLALINLLLLVPLIVRYRRQIEKAVT
jgi:uncharacterized membrane protein YdjX (TVP38/TMEM64 family)